MAPNIASPRAGVGATKKIHAKTERFGDLPKYVEGPLSQDVFWSGATEGMLGPRVQQPQHPVNALLDPRELAELEAGTKGSIVGVGVAIEMVVEVVVIREVIPGSPAAKADLHGGDRILGVDGILLPPGESEYPLDYRVGGSPVISARECAATTAEA